MKLVLKKLLINFSTNPFICSLPMKIIGLIKIIIDFHKHWED